VRKLVPVQNSLDNILNESEKQNNQKIKDLTNELETMHFHINNPKVLEAELKSELIK